MAGGRETGGWANTRCFTALAPSPARQELDEWRGGISPLGISQSIHCSKSTIWRDLAWYWVTSRVSGETKGTQLDSWHTPTLIPFPVATYLENT